jgi:hypothetical protein
MRLSSRVLGGLGVVVAAVLVQTASAAAQDDVISFSGRLFVTPAPAGQTPFGVVLSDTCQHTTAEGEAVPCVVVATGAVEPVGTAEAFAVSREGVFILHEEFVFDPSTGAGTGTGDGTKIDLDNGQVDAVTFTATFNTAPTDNPNVFLDSGVVNIDEVE